MNEAKARRIVAERSGGLCELGCGAPATDWAHRRSRAQGGPWRPANSCHLDRRCHQWTEAHPLLAAAGGWRLVHDDRNPAVVPAWLSPALTWPGWWYLDDEGGYVAGPSLPVPVLPPWMAQAA